MTSIPRPVDRMAELMSTFRPWWALCGGWAVDTWIGERTRTATSSSRCSSPSDRTTSGSYKGTASFGDAEMTKRRSHDDVDFETLRDRLDRDERTWLRDSVSRLYSNHLWLERLSDQDHDQDRDRP